jgi:phosphate transport system protein
MTHYEERLETDVNRIRSRVEAVASDVQDALKNAMHALLSGNEILAYATVMGDTSINRTVREIDRLCNAFVALHLPSAGHLRLISSVMRASLELERLGDYAVTIARESVQLATPPTGTLARELELMSEEARNMLKQALMAFNEGNSDRARATMSMAEQVERTFDAVFSDLVGGDGHSVRDLFAYFVVFNHLERVSDQAKNLCEETVYMVDGETKAPKAYQILFIDDENSCQSQMAEAIARKNFPNSGRYLSAGHSPADKLYPGLQHFMEQRGIDLSNSTPKPLDLTPAELARNYAMVGLQAPVRTYVSEIPFHTVALHWDIGPAPEGLDEQQSIKRFEEMYREIALQVRDLMTTLRGDGAS